MVSTTIEQYFNESQVSFINDSKIICILCEGQHGNNSLCQIQGGEYYVS